MILAGMYFKVDVLNRILCIYPGLAMFQNFLNYDI